MPASIEQLKQQIQQLDELVRAGTLSAEQAGESRLKLEKQVIDAVMAGGATAMASAAPATLTSTPVARASRLLLLGMGVFVLAVAGVGYHLVGQPGAWGVGPGGDNGASAQGDGQAGQHTMNTSDVQGMIDKLAAKLAKDPNNAEGWGMLGRSYAAMERFQDAVDAYRKGLKLRPDDAELLADYADALGMVQGRSLEGEPAAAVTKALKSDPNNFKALSLAGTIAFEHKDFKQAAELWGHAVERAPADNPQLAQQLRDALNEARQRAGLPPLASAEASSPASPQAAQPVAAGSAHVSGTVTLAPALQAQVSPDDTVFIFARAANGPKMPLAIVRKQVKDLPISFTLDDSQAMSPQMKLSAFPEVVIGARISRTGDAMPKDGDFAGQTEAIKVGSDGVRVEIAHTITVNR